MLCCRLGVNVVGVLGNEAEMYGDFVGFKDLLVLANFKLPAWRIPRPSDIIITVIPKKNPATIDQFLHHIMSLLMPFLLCWFFFRDIFAYYEKFYLFIVVFLR